MGILTMARLIALLALFCCCCTYVVQGKRVAEEECDIYRGLITREHGIIPLTLNPQPLYFRVYNCTQVVELITGGKQARYGEFPHQALLGYPTVDDESVIRFDCGGSLISNLYVLTAAHCFINGDPTVVRLGENDLTITSKDELDIPVAEAIRHPKHKYRQAYHDIALVRLKRVVRFSKTIRPACLWTSDNINVTKFIATGFGHQEFGGTANSPQLMKVQLDLFPSADCAQQFESNTRFKHGIDSGQMCVGSLVGGKDTCQGDSGGPLQTVNDVKGCLFHVIGVTSTGPACGVGHSKAVYTKVSHYLDWIEQVVWGS